MRAIDFSDPKAIASLTEALTSAGVKGLEISWPSGQVRIVVSGPADVRLAARPSAPLVAIKAPMAGIFSLSEADAADDLPRSVAPTDVLGFLRVGLVLLPLSTGQPGMLKRRCVDPDALVGFGDVLFEIEPQS